VTHYAVQEAFAGRVVRVSPVIDPATRTFRVEVEVRQKDGGLRPGMFVRTRIVAERHEQVPVVPRHAVVTRGGDRVVFVVDKQRAVQRRVVVGLGDDERIEIREGVRPGESLVTTGYETLVDGARVRVSAS
jgi:RND family efflux transporter MFP subunit